MFGRLELNTIWEEVNDNHRAGNHCFRSGKVHATEWVPSRRIVMLVFCRLFHLINDQNLHGSLLQFQFQAQLFLNRREERRPRGIGR